MRGQKRCGFFAAEHAAKARADEERIIRTGEPLIGKIERITTRDGRQGWASTTKMPWRDAAGEIIGTYGLTRDVTEAKQAEEKLVEERNLLRTIIDHLPSRLYVKDTAARYVMNNLAHLRVLGVDTQAATVGRTVLDFFSGERGAQAMADDQQVLQGGPSILNQEKSDFGAEGSIHWSLVTKRAAARHARQFDRVGGHQPRHHAAQTGRGGNPTPHRRDGSRRSHGASGSGSIPSRPLPVFPPSALLVPPTLHFAHRYLPTSTLGGDFFDRSRSATTAGCRCAMSWATACARASTALVRGVVGSRPSHRRPGRRTRGTKPQPDARGRANRPAVFATAFYGIIDLRRQRLTYANAGHPPPLIARTGSSAIQRLTPEDPEPATGLIGGFRLTRGSSAISRRAISYSVSPTESLKPRTPLVTFLARITFVDSSLGGPNWTPKRYVATLRVRSALTTAVRPSTTTCASSRWHSTPAHDYLPLPAPETWQTKRVIGPSKPIAIFYPLH
jgi:PAS domain-containing protein